ncbi:MAG: RrF2 family transcriptional regulator [Bacillota bacterium]
MSIISMSEMTSLALHGIMYIGLQENTLVSVKEVAEALGASEAHLSKVLQKLVKAGFLSSIRGPKGGFALAKAKDKIKLYEIYELFEGKVNEDCGCPMSRKQCAFKACPFKKVFSLCYKEFYKEFTEKTLADAFAMEEKQL